MTTPPKSANWLQILQHGQNYMNSWPVEKRLSLFFPDSHIVRATKYGIRLMPPLAIFTLCWQIALGGSLGIAIATASFACSLPMQGLWWLGRRSLTPLPQTLAQWFYHIRQRIVDAGQLVEPIEKLPTYQHLAELLHLAFKQLDKTFLDEL